MKKYILTKTDCDFPIGSTMFLDEKGNAYVVYEGEHPRGYNNSIVEFDGRAYQTYGFPWVLLKVFGYEAKEEK